MTSHYNIIMVLDTEHSSLEVHNVTKFIWKYETATAEIKCARYFALVIDR